jgi:hypothetical protein
LEREQGLIVFLKSCLWLKGRLSETREVAGEVRVLDWIREMWGQQEVRGGSPWGIQCNWADSELHLIWHFWKGLQERKLDQAFPEPHPAEGKAIEDAVVLLGHWEAQRGVGATCQEGRSWLGSLVGAWEPSNLTGLSEIRKLSPSGADAVLWPAWAQSIASTLRSHSYVTSLEGSAGGVCCSSLVQIGKLRSREVQGLLWRPDIRTDLI